MRPRAGAVSYSEHGAARQRRTAAVMLVLAVLWPLRSHAAIEMHDDRGAVLRLAAPAKRIVALAPHLAEIVYAAGAGQKLVGVSRFSDFPSAARHLPRVGEAGRVDLERVVLLRPDLVLAWKSGNPGADVARLEQLGLAVFVTEPAHLDDIPRLLHAVGTLAGTAAAAERAEMEFMNKYNALRKRYAGRPPLKVFYEIWPRPLMTVNRDHVISDVISLCGGRNIFADAPALTPMVSIEAVLAARPDLIIGGSSAEKKKGFLAQWRQSPVTELRNLPVFYVTPDLIQRQTPRILEGARIVCADLEQVRKNREKAKSR